MRSSFLFSLTACSMAAFLVACGGGSDTVVPGSNTPTAPATPTTIEGAAVKGPVDGAKVTVKKASDGATLGETTTNSDGTYKLDINFIGDVVVEVTGGTYTDEATQVKTPLAAPLKAVLAANGAKVSGVVTPITTMAYTSAFPTTSTPVTSAAFKTQAASLANQFQLTGVDLTTTLPLVTGTQNAYGQALASLSKYLNTNKAVDLNKLVNEAYKSAQFSGDYSAAYATVTGNKVTYSFSNGTATTTVAGGGAGGTDLTVTTTGTDTSVTGSGAGGGTGTCGVNVQGTISQTAAGQSFSIPLNMNVCVTGIAAGSCSASNAALNQSVAGANGVAGAANLKYTYSEACAAGAFNIALK